MTQIKISQKLKVIYPAGRLYVLFNPKRKNSSGKKLVGESHGQQEDGKVEQGGGGQGKVHGFFRLLIRKQFPEKFGCPFSRVRPNSCFLFGKIGENAG